MISNFRGKWKSFSNFFPGWIMYNLLIWESVEHAFQAAKDVRGVNSKLFLEILELGPEKAWKAKKIGRQIERDGFLRPDWKTGHNKIVMAELIKIKFDPVNRSDLRRILNNSKGHILVEGNTWHDNFWGDCRCEKCRHIKGENNLGKILMKERDGVLLI